MPVQLDPEGRETNILFDFVGSFASKQVLEVGCGDGRLTWQYALEAEHVVGIDPDPDEIAMALANIPHQLRDRVEFLASGIEEFRPTRRFDLAILSWSL